jgi:UDP-N-acetylglucosamine acyltransferase
MTRIHPTAIVDPSAELAPDVTVGAYSVIGRGVSIGPGTTVAAHVAIEGPCRIGANNRIHPFASLGGAPQDKKYRGEPTTLEIGDGNTIREYVTLNRGTVQGNAVTRIGDDNWIMAYVHVAHDCVIGSHTIFANCTNLGGHVEIGDWVVLVGYTGVHQFCKLGAHVMTGVGSVVLHDVPPFVMVAGNTAQAHGINAEGLRRRGFDKADIERIRRAYRTLYRSGLTLEEARRALFEQAASGGAGSEHIRKLAEFLERVTRGIVR